MNPILKRRRAFYQTRQYKLKIKSVYEVIIRKHEITEETSLSSFKRFLKSKNLRKVVGITCRIEQAPGQEIQIDYGEVGKMLNPLTGKRSAVYTEHCVHRAISLLSLFSVRIRKFCSITHKDVPFFWRSKYIFFLT